MSGFAAVTWQEQRIRDRRSSDEDIQFLIHELDQARETIRMLGVPVEDADELRRALKVRPSATFADVVKQAIAFAYENEPL